MKLISLITLLSFLAVQTVIAQDTITPYDSTLAVKYGADDHGMKTYVMALLKRGPNRDRSKEQADELMRGHMANINRLAKEGKLIVAGPFYGDGDMRGIYIFDVESIEEAEKLTLTDPAIEAGSLVMELHKWYGSAALMAIPEIYPKFTLKNP